MPRAAYWHKVPFGLADCAATIRFRRELRAGPLSHAYLVNLWGWCAQHNRPGKFSGEFGAACVADAADWHGNPMRFLGALVQSGFATVTGPEIVLIDPLVACVKEWNSLPKGIEKGSERDAKGTRKGAKKESKGSGKGQQPEAATASGGPETPVSARAHTGETETETKTGDQDQEPSSGKPDPAEPPADAPKDLFGTTPPAQPTPESLVTAVLEDWRARVGMPGAAIEGKPAEKRRTRIRARMAEGWTPEGLAQVVSGALRDDFLMGRDPKARPGGWRDVESVFRDNAQCERLEALAAGVFGASQAGRPAVAAHQQFEDDAA